MGMGCCVSCNTVSKIGPVFRVGIELATVEVRCESLTMEAKISVGSRALPTVLNAYRDFFEVRCRTSLNMGLNIQQQMSINH